MDYAVKVGQTLDGRFKITDLIGRGGTASVFEAIDCSSGEVVAVKVPHLRCESDPVFYQRFEREEAIGTGLRHPGIVRVIPVECRSRPYIVMERLKGRLLSDKLSEDPRPCVAESLRIAADIADALEYLHSRGVVHRDLKPSNVMLCPDGTIRLIDLGLAKGKGHRALTVFGFSPAMGSPDYMSPEQAAGRGGDERSDVYSLGAVLYKMVTRQVPFPGADPMARMTARLVGDPLPPRAINPEVPEGVEDSFSTRWSAIPRTGTGTPLR